ncbi:YhgE/Pip domain-containing protein [uncultured Microbacterium sp.]|uniref:YhgE/Pip domain-containing protein n=1 Tax=uncultured Microbacterium sp. TaxID=191216 RepID=UPI0035C97B64
MTLSIERARSRRPVTWLTLVGVLLLPVIVGGILVAALYNPVERLGTMNAAIVNEDVAVTVNGQLAPLGRQLTAGLVEGSNAAPSNLTWTISNAEDAAAGLADGTYNSVITIPEGFSAAATSVANGADATQATISIQSAPDARVVDDAITAQIATTAASVFGEELSKTYLQNVFVGFSTLSTQLGQAADGATQLATGAQSAASGAAQLPSGATQLATGATALGDGATALATGADQLASGLDTLTTGVGASASGASALASGLSSGADTVQYGSETVQLEQAAQATAGSVAQAAAASATVATSLGTLSTQCTASGASQSFCDSLTATAVTAGSAAKAAGTANGYAPAVASGIPLLAAGAAQGMRDAASGAQQLASGLTQIQGGAGQSADGARRLASGGSQLSSGASQLSTGAGQLATGAQSLSDGVAQLATSTSTLADGLHTAATSVPSYTDAQAKNLAAVVADPVAAKGIGANLFGASAIPLLAMLALWFGGFGSFIALQAVSRRALTSRRPSAFLALRSLAPAAAISIVQGLMVAGVVQLAASYDWGTWAVFAAICAVAGVAFAAVNQALVAVFGGAGRWISGLIGVLSLATGVVSTVPGVLSALAGLLPTSPAYNGMLAALTSTGGVGAAIVGMVVWAVLAFVASTLAVARRRTVSARTLLSASPLPA